MAQSITSAINEQQLEQQIDPEDESSLVVQEESLDHEQQQLRSSSSLLSQSSSVSQSSSTEGMKLRRRQQQEQRKADIHQRQELVSSINESVHPEHGHSFYRRIEDDVGPNHQDPQHPSRSNNKNDEERESLLSGDCWKLAASSSPPRDETTYTISRTTTIVVDDVDRRNAATTTALAYEHNGTTRRGKYHYYGTIVLFGICTILLFADQNLMAPNLSAIAADFQMNDMERDTKLGGEIAFAFFMIGAPASLLFGYLADHPPPTVSSRTSHSSTNIPDAFYNLLQRKYRILLFSITVIMGETSCCCTALVQTYWQLYICRALTGFSLGGAFPVLYSLLGDWFAPEQRHNANAITGIGMGIGVALGQLIAGFMGPKYGWRIPFIIVSIPAILLALIMVLIIDDPERGGMEKHTNTIINNNENSADYDPLSVIPENHQEQQPLVDGTNIFDDKNNNTELCSSSSSDAAQRPAVLQQHEDEMRVGVSNDCDTDSFPSSPSCLVPPSSSKMEYSNNNFVEMTSLGNVSVNNSHHETYVRTSLNGDIEENNILPPDDSNRQSSEASSSESWNDTLITLFKTPTCILAFLQGGPGCVPWGIVNTYLNDYLSSDRGLSIESATLVIAIFGISTFFGQVIGGTGGTYLYQRNVKYPSLLACSSAILGCIPFWILLSVDFHHVDDNNFYKFWFLLVLIAVLAGTGCGITGPIIKATLQNVTVPYQRGQAFALFNIADDFGRGLGPVYVAGLIRITKSRERAFIIGTFGWVICGIMNGLVYFFIENDERNCQQRYENHIQMTQNDITDIAPMVVGTASDGIDEQK